MYGFEWFQAPLWGCWIFYGTITISIPIWWMGCWQLARESLTLKRERWMITAILVEFGPISWRDCVLSQGNGWILLLQGYGLTYNEGVCLHGGIKFGGSVRGEKKIYTKPARQSIQMFTPKLNVSINIVTSESYALISVKPPLKSIYSISFSCSFFQSAFTTTMCVFE